MLAEPLGLNGREPSAATGDAVAAASGETAGSFENPLLDRLERASAAVVRGEKASLSGARGSGVIVGTGGTILTAGHVAVDKDGNPLSDLWILRNVPGRGSRFFKVVVRQVFGYGDNGRDLALLAVADGQEAEEPFLGLEIGHEPSTGAEVVASGFPLVFDRVYRWPLMRWGRVATSRFFYREAKVLVLDMTSIAGFSGAPVVDAQTGKLVAIIKGKATGNPQSDFCLATTVLRKDIEP